MTLTLKTLPQSNGGWMKPATIKDAVAILIEVTSFDKQRPTPNGPKDSALCNVSVFMTDADLVAGTPQVSNGQRIEQTALARDLESLVGAATLATLTQKPASKPGAHPAWVFEPVTEARKVNAVLAWAEKRDAAEEAALEDVPDF